MIWFDLIWFDMIWYIYIYDIYTIIFKYDIIYIYIFMIYRYTKMWVNPQTDGDLRLQDQMHRANPRQKVGIAGVNPPIISWLSEFKQHQSAKKSSIMWLRSWIAEAKSCTKLAESQNGRGKRPKTGKTWSDIRSGLFWERFHRLIRFPCCGAEYPDHVHWPQPGDQRIHIECIHSTQPHVVVARRLG